MQTGQSKAAQARFVQGPYPEPVCWAQELTYIFIYVKEGRNHGILDLIEIWELPEHLEHAPHALAAGVVAWDIFQ